MLCPLHSCQCYAASKQGQAQQGPVASSREQSQEGHCIYVCIPTPGYRGVQEDEPLAEGTILCPPQDWQGVLLLMHCTYLMRYKLVMAHPVTELQAQSLEETTFS